MAKKIKAKDIAVVASFLKTKKVSFKAFVMIFALGMTVGVMWEETVGVGTWHSYHPKLDKMNLCFTPPAGCESLIAQEITKANSSIYIQAYGFSSTPIIYQLKRAVSRGVKVSVILDGGNLSNNYDIASELRNYGMEVYIDKLSGGIAHNKVMIFDKKKIITGSFNFTHAANSKNAENVVLIEDEKIADAYFKNWLYRKDKSTAANTTATLLS